MNLPTKNGQKKLYRNGKYINHGLSTSGSIHPTSPTRPDCIKKTGLITRVRHTIGKIVNYIYDLSNSVRLYKIYAALIVGKEKHSSKTIRTFYIGHGQNFFFIMNRIYSEFEVIKRQNQINAFFTKKWIEKFSKLVDIVVADVELLFCSLLFMNNFIKVPPWILQKVDIVNEWNDVVQNFRPQTKRETLRKIKNKEFTVKIVDSRNDFKYFYHRMYLPYIRNRYKKEAIIETEKNFYKECRKGKLIYILRDNELLGGFLFQQYGVELSVLWGGVPEGLQINKYKGSTDALYYYIIRLGYEYGCKRVNLYGTRALLNDGLFFFKRKWGAYVERKPVPCGDILLKPLNLNEAVRSFFVHNYFITRDRKTLTAKILSNDNKLTIEGIRELVECYFSRGLDHFKIFSLKGYEHSVYESAKKEFPYLKLFDLSKSSHPERDFSRL